MPVENKTENKTPTASRSNTGQRLFTELHTFFYRLSGGKLGGHFGKGPVLLLTTTGRKTGKQRTTPLIYRQEDGNLILVASNGGAPTHPVWWLNLQAKPEAEVEIGSKKMHVTARQADAQERASLADIADCPPDSPRNCFAPPDGRTQALRVAADG
jgi:deazaflavin-dependent oxidoreductase (nitroreductase family)